MSTPYKLKTFFNGWWYCFQFFPSFRLCYWQLGFFSSKSYVVSSFLILSVAIPRYYLVFYYHTTESKLESVVKVFWFYLLEFNVNIRFRHSFHLFIFLIVCHQFILVDCCLVHVILDPASKLVFLIVGKKITLSTLIYFGNMHLVS